MYTIEISLYDDCPYLAASSSEMKQETLLVYSGKTEVMMPAPTQLVIRGASRVDCGEGPRSHSSSDLSFTAVVLEKDVMVVLMKEEQKEEEMQAILVRLVATKWKHVLS
jgi:hypothetical protein